MGSSEANSNVFELDFKVGAKATFLATFGKHCQLYAPFTITSNRLSDPTGLNIKNDAVSHPPCTWCVLSYRAHRPQ